MKILHITNWHPNKENPVEAIWMHRHVLALSRFCENEVWHLEVRAKKPFKLLKYTDDLGCHHRILDVPFKRTFFIEILTAFILLWVLVFKINKKEFHLLNFHIAYPLLIYWKWIRKFVNLPVLITEHWSAYHRNFGLPLNTNKLNKVKAIFNMGIPVITVSKALANDIKLFSNNPDLISHIIPNVVDGNTFSCTCNNMPDVPVFFILSKWAYPKTPHIVIEAFANFLSSHTAYLVIGGYGELIPEMKRKVLKLGIQSNVRFLGKIMKEEIAENLNNASAFLHCTDYETFSVVCAEAASCGTPVIASNRGGIPEFITDENGILVDENSVNNWKKALNEFIQDYSLYNRELIANNANSTFNSKTVGQKYYNIILNEVKNQ